MMAQRVNISVGSDCVPVEDIAIFREDQEVEIESTADKDIITNGKVDTEHLTDDKKSVVCCVGQEKPTKKENRSKNKTAVKKRCSKTRFSVSYHISLNRALSNINKECANHKQT